MTQLDSYHAVLFDLDGVLTPTALVHMRAWGDLFTDYLALVGAAPYQDQDYFDYIDGKPRYEGVAAMLAARGIELPWGDPADAPGTETVCGLGNRKNAVFTQVLERDGVEPYPGSVRLVQALAAAQVPQAVVSSSFNAPAVLRAAGLAKYFHVVVDGAVARDRQLAGKPRPDTFLYAARALGSDAARAVVVEDALAGVRAGAAGGFGLVVGVDRGVGDEELRDGGADIVVSDLAELL